MKQHQPGFMKELFNKSAGVLLGCNKEGGFREPGEVVYLDLQKTFNKVYYVLYSEVGSRNKALNKELPI